MIVRTLMLSCLVVLLVGCGKSETVIPTDELTEAQKAAIKAEDASIEMEESQGKMPKPKTKK